jgi:nucleotide-binding universal stress UspA family protein
MYRTIEVPLDGSKLAEQALPHAIALAHRLGAGLVLVRIAEFGPGVVYAHEHEREALKQAENYLGSLKQLITDPACKLALPPERVTIFASFGKAAREIVQVGTMEKCDLIMMTTHGFSGLSRLLLGSVAFEVFRRAQLPVMLIRPDGLGAEPLMLSNLYNANCLTSSDLTPAKMDGSVVVTLDGSTKAESALPVALKLAHQLDSHLYLLRVVTLRLPFVPYDQEKEAEKLREEAYQYLDKLEGELILEGVRCSKVVRLGDAPDEILDYLYKAHPVITVMATHPRSSLGQIMLGGVTEEVLRKSHLPVMLVPITS